MTVRPKNQDSKRKYAKISLKVPSFPLRNANIWSSSWSIRVLASQKWQKNWTSNYRLPSSSLGNTNRLASTTCDLSKSSKPSSATTLRSKKSTNPFSPPIWVQQRKKRVKRMLWKYKQSPTQRCIITSATHTSACMASGRLIIIIN